MRSFGALYRVAGFGNGFDHSRTMRVVGEGLAQLDDGVADRVAADHGAGPDRRLELPAADELPRSLGEMDQHRHDLGLELDRLIAQSNPQIGFEVVPLTLASQ